MKLRNKKMIAIAVAGTIVASTLSLGAAQLTKQVQVRYNNIKVQVDNQYKQPSLEPFFIGDSVYVSLRDAGELVGAKVGWETASQTVKIDTSTVAGGNSSEIQKLKQELANATVKLNAAESKIAKYEKELGLTEDGGSTTTPEDDNNTSDSEIDLTELKDILYDEYQNEYKIKWSFVLKGDEDGLNLGINFDGNRYKNQAKDLREKDWADLARYMVETIQKEVQSEYGIKNIRVDGRIYDTKNKATVMNFDISSKGRFDYEIIKPEISIEQKDLDAFAAKIKEDFKDFPDLTLQGAYDGRNIRVNDVELKENKGEIEYKITINLMDLAHGYWKNMDQNDFTAVETYMKDIQRVIYNKFDIDSVGYIANGSKTIGEYENKLKVY